jgi:hypothetical protein
MQAVVTSNVLRQTGVSVTFIYPVANSPVMDVVTRQVVVAQTLHLWNCWGFEENQGFIFSMQHCGWVL